MVARSAATHRLDVLAVVEAQDRKTACREGQIELSLPKGMTLEQVLDPNTKRQRPKLFVMAGFSGGRCRVHVWTRKAEYGVHLHPVVAMAVILSVQTKRSSRRTRRYTFQMSFVVAVEDFKTGAQKEI
jgi:hypothetical protein